MQLNMVGPYIIEPNHCLGLSLLHFILIGLQELKLFLQALGADASGRLVVGVKGLFLFINHYDILNYLSELVLKILIKMKICVFVVCLLGLTGTLDLSPEEDKHNTVIESNHYFSDYQLGTTYNINKVRKDRPIIYFLKKKNSQPTLDNKITIKLMSGDVSSECVFESYHGLCYLNNLPEEDMKMKLTCQHLPCQASWTILQPPLSDFKSSTAIQELYDISESSNHLMVVLSCNNPQLKNFGERFEVYSEDAFIRGDIANLVYLLFPKEKKAHVYINMGKAAKACAELPVIYQVPSSIEDDELVKDFVLSNATNTYKLAFKPTEQFSIDGEMHFLDQITPTISTLTVSLVGQKSGQKELISTLNIKPNSVTYAHNFHAVFPKIPDEYSGIQLQMKSSDKTTIVNFQFSTTKVQMEATQHSYFSLKKDQSLAFKLKGQPSAKADERVAVYSSDEKAKISVKECSLKDGCNFDIHAEEDVLGDIYIGKDIKEKKEGQINFIPFTDSFTHKIKESQKIYLKREIQNGKAIQVVVNTPNVIIYAAPTEKCETPSEECYEKVANMHNPFIYQPKKDKQLRFMVKGLENTQFTLTVISGQGDAIALTDGQPFSYLMDDHEDQLVFSFTLPETNGVSFNLVSSIGDLFLVVRNDKKEPQYDEDVVSREGIVSLAKKQVKGNDFRIKVMKTEEAQRKYVHFSLIASTSQTQMRLEPAVPYYQTMKPKEERKFMFQFDKDEDYLLNFYIHNIPDVEVNVPLTVAGSKGTKSKIKQFTLDKSTDVLNLKDVSEELCESEGQVSCQIFIQLVNTMKIQLDITITLLMKESVVELKDGIWETFAINTIAESTHFYFFPKLVNQSVSIMYKSDIFDIQLSYNLWKSDQKGINPAEWPFPGPKPQKQKMSAYQPIKHISIDAETLKGCSPSCIVLISVYRKKLDITKALAVTGDATFSIMAANQLIQIPEKTKLDILLKAGEEKYLLIDLKYALEKEAITFFTATILGAYTLYGNVYSEANPRCPEEFDSDFDFGVLQTQIRMETIQNKLQDNQMQEDTNIYICLLAKSYIETKFSIEYTTDEDIIKLLKPDSFENVELEAGETKMFQLDASQEYKLKFTREKGYFYAAFVQCKKKDGYQECLEEFQSKAERDGKQIIAKTEEFKQEPCQQCIIFVKLYSEESAQVLLHVQSTYSTIELKENDVISDFANENEMNKYSITSVKNEEVIISMNVLEGDPIVRVSDTNSYSVEKEKDPNTNMIHVIVPAIEKKAEGNPLALGGSYYDSYALSSTFRYFVVTVKSKNEKLACSYTISYSSGESQVYLEDGLVTSYSLQKDRKSTFFYNNPNKASHGYLTISTPKSALLYRMDIKMFSFTDPNDEDTKVEFTPEKPPMRKKTPNPTITYSIPAEKKISVEVTADEDAKITLVVNHQELILLPFDQEFPFILHPKEDLNLLVDVNNPGYLMITIRKCDESAPELGYTFNYDAFQKSQFQYTTTLAQQPKFEYLVKANKVGTLYMNIHTTTENSIIALNVHYSDSKIIGNKAKPGNEGLMKYSIISGNKAKITFTGITCTKSKCDKDIQYSWLSSTSMQDVYSQTVCPYSYFSSLDVKSGHPIELRKITSTPNSNNQIEFEYPLPDETSYVSVKATMGNEEVYYQPTEIITFWGSIAKQQKSGHFGVIVLFSCCCCVGLLMVRKLLKWWKKGPQDYDKLESELDM